LIEPFCSGSHQSWAEAIKRHSSHTVVLFSLPGKFCKWRMRGGAWDLAERLQHRLNEFDLILASDMLDLNRFLGCLSKRLPTGIYFHENQLTYPWSKHDRNLQLHRL